MKAPQVILIHKQVWEAAATPFYEQGLLQNREAKKWVSNLYKLTTATSYVSQEKSSTSGLPLHTHCDITIKSRKSHFKCFHQVFQSSPLKCRHGHVDQLIPQG